MLRKKLLLLCFVFLTISQNLFSRKIDVGPWVNAEIKYYDNKFIIKNINNFMWTNININIQEGYFEYNLERLNANEICVIEFSEFIDSTGIINEIGTKFNGDKIQIPIPSQGPCYIVRINTDQGHETYLLFEENQINTPVYHSEESNYDFILAFLFIGIVFGIFIFLLIIKIRRKKY
jgi:hypothetical protein